MMNEQLPEFWNGESLDTDLPPIYRRVLAIKGGMIAWLVLIIEPGRKIISNIDPRTGIAIMEYYTPDDAITWWIASLESTKKNGWVICDVTNPRNIPTTG